MVITRYNETEVDARAVNLTNQVDEVDIIVPVGFSYPAGSFRISEAPPVTFTHFTVNLPSADGTRVFKITRWTAINSEVIEYFYELDYLKDYWLRNASSGTLSIPKTLINSVYPAPLTYTGNYFPINTHLTGIADTIVESNGNTINVSKAFFIMNIGDSQQELPGTRCALKNSSNEIICCKTLYYINDSALIDDLNCVLMKKDTSLSPDTLNSFYCDIDKAFYAPVLFPNTGATITYNNVVSYIDNDGTIKTKDFSSTTLNNHLAYVTLPTSNGIVENICDTGIDISILTGNDLPPYKKYEMYVPYVGWYSIPVNEICSTVYMGNVQRIMVKYYFDLINATISCKFGLKYDTTTYWSNYQTPYQPLPTIGLCTSDYASNSIAADNILNTTLQNNAISSLISIGSNMVAGNIGGIGNSISGLLTNKIKAESAHAHSQLLANMGGFSSGRDSTNGLVDRQYKLKTTTFKTSLTLTQGEDLYGFPLFEYTDTIVLNQGTTRLWLETSNSSIKGSMEYVERVRQEYGKDYIAFAASTP